MSILLDVGIGLEINVLTSKFILLGDQMLGEMGCHPEICFYRIEIDSVIIQNPQMLLVVQDHIDITYFAESGLLST